MQAIVYILLGLAIIQYVAYGFKAMFTQHYNCVGIIMK